MCVSHDVCTKCMHAHCIGIIKQVAWLGPTLIKTPSDILCFICSYPTSSMRCQFFFVSLPSSSSSLCCHILWTLLGRDDCETRHGNICCFKESTYRMEAHRSFWFSLDSSSPPFQSNVMDPPACACACLFAIVVQLLSRFSILYNCRPCLSVANAINVTQWSTHIQQKPKQKQKQKISYKWFDFCGSCFCFFFSLHCFERAHTPTISIVFVILYVSVWFTSVRKSNQVYPRKKCRQMHHKANEVQLCSWDRDGRQSNDTNHKHTYNLISLLLTLKFGHTNTLTHSYTVCTLCLILNTLYACARGCIARFMQ